MLLVPVVLSHPFHCLIFAVELSFCCSILPGEEQHAGQLGPGKERKTWEYKQRFEKRIHFEVQTLQI